MVIKKGLRNPSAKEKIQNYHFYDDKTLCMVYNIIKITAKA